jgi:hypothetical protein
MSGLRRIAVGVHVAEARQRFAGIEVGARMTALELGGGLLVHSPIDVEPSTVTTVGEPRWVLAPNLLHHLYVGPWAESGLEVWAAPGLPEKRPDVAFAGVAEADTHPFGSDVRLMALRCFGMTNEVVLLHRPSRTLVVSDLVYRFTRDAPWLTRAAMWCLRGYPGCRTSLIERFGFDRTIAREEIATIASWDFDRLVMAHGEVLETGAKDAFVRAFDWLSVPGAAGYLTP